MNNGRNVFAAVYDLFFHPGEVTELRALGITGKDRAWDMEFARKGGIIFGYFDNAKNFADAAYILSKKNGTAVYFTLNPVKPACLSRANNRLKIYDKATDKQTTDDNIKCIRWLMIDLDPARTDGVKGIPTTKQELGNAKDLGKQITDWLTQQHGFPRPFAGMSGNGYHIFYRLPDMDNTAETAKKSGVIHNAILAIQKQFPNPLVDIDTGVYKAGQLGRVYGTVNRKGDSTADRPHRLTYLLKNVPASLAGVEIVDIKKIQALAHQISDATILPPAPLPSTLLQQAGNVKRLMNQLGQLKVDEYLAHYAIEIHDIKHDGDRTMYRLKQCVFNPEHQNGNAAISTTPGPPYITYHCFHTSCQGHKWEDARRVISGTDKIARFYTNFDPEWKPKKEAATGVLDTITIKDVAADIPAPPEGLVHPTLIDPMEFHIMSGKSKRPVLVEERMVDYLAAYLAPMWHTAGIFWKYSGGVWKPFPEGTINKIIILALGNRIKGANIDPIKKVLAGKINKEESTWPSNIGLVNAQNGMIDIPGHKMLPHSPDYGSRAQLPVPYDIDVDADRWHKLLNEVFPEPASGDEKRDLLQQFAGYCLLNTCRYEKALFCCGNGGNGKSTILDTIDEVIGQENKSSLSLDELGYRFNIPYMMNKLINHAGEMDPKAQIDTKILKAAISGEWISGEYKHGKRVEFRNTAKFIFSMNQTPGITEKTKGIARRLLVLYFTKDFENDPNKDTHLKDYLRENELPGILTWMLIGAEKVLKNDGFYYGAEIEKDRQRFLRTMNPVMLFVEERCAVEPKITISCQELFKTYMDWSHDSNHKPLGRTNFYEQILQFWPTRRDKITLADGTRRWAFEGITVRL